MKQQELIKKIKSCIKSKDPGAEVFLYGSRARGDHHKNSDWDILVITPRDHVTFDFENELRDPIYDLELESGEVISLLVYSVFDWQKRKSISPLFMNVDKEGKKI